MIPREVGAAALLVGVAATLAYANGTLNHFFVFGPISDAFWFAGLIWHIDAWMTNPPSIDQRSYFATHFSPFLYLPGLLSRAAPTDPISFFAGTIGLLHGAASGVFAAIAGTALHRAGVGRHVAAAATCAVGAAVIALPLQFLFLILPHFEIVMPALLLAFLAALAIGADRVATACFFALMIVREDAGLHAAMFLLAWEGGRRLSGEGSDPRLLRFAQWGLAWSAVAFSLGPLIAGGSQGILRGLYVGEPPFAHLAPAALLARIAKFVVERTDLWLPLAAILAAAAWRRDARLAAGVVAVLPWLGLNVGLGYHSGPARLEYYYAFPLIIAFAWPSLRLLMTPRAAGACRHLSTLQAVVLALGFVPGLVPQQWSTEYLWRHASVTSREGLRKRPSYVDFSNAIAALQPTMGNAVAASSVVGLASEILPRAIWAEHVDANDRDAIAKLDTLLVFERPSGCIGVDTLAGRIHLEHALDVVGTRIVILTRLPVERFDAWGARVAERPFGGTLCRPRPIE